MGNLIGKIKYGKVIDYKSDFFHVAGPVDNTGRAIGNKMNLEGFMDSSLIEKDGQVYDSSFKSQKDYFNFLKTLGKNYLEGKIDFNEVLPISSERFMLPLDKEKINYVLQSIDNLRELTFSGKIKQPLSIGNLSDVFLTMNNPEYFLENTEESKETAIKKAQNYVKDILFWRLNCSDYSDHVSISITERVKQQKNRNKRTFIIDREWSKANKDSLGYRVVEKDNEKIIISGYNKLK